MTELWGQDHNAYPSALLATDEDVELVAAESILFAIFAGTTSPHGFTVRAGETLVPGQLVEFTVTAWALNCEDNEFSDCPDPNPYTFSVEFGGPVDG